MLGIFRPTISSSLNSHFLHHSTHFQSVLHSRQRVQEVKNMLKRLDSVKEYIDFINEINSDVNFSDPMLCTDEQLKCNLFDAVNKTKTNYIFGIFEEQTLIGLFVFLILEDEAYIEMLVGLSKNPKAYEEMLAYLKAQYKGYKMDFVYNPKNYMLHEILQKENAEFEAEQQKMVLKKEVVF